MTAVSRILTASLAMMASVAFATASTTSGIGAMATQLQNQFSAIMLMITGGATLGGYAIFILGIFKIKAWKDNPQQNPLATGAMLCVVGLLLVYLPSFLGSGGASLFSDGTSAGIAGATDLT
jgi:hypothetical protein